MRITVTVPHAVNNDNAYVYGDFDSIDNTELAASTLTLVKRQMSRSFGGFTAHEADGGWIDNTGLLVEEKVTVVESYTDEDPDKAEDCARIMALTVINALYQDAAMYTIDNEAKFVDKEWKPKLGG
jgi:hypothetical protein